MGMKRHGRPEDRANRYLKQLQQMLELGVCHPSWGRKRMARVEKWIEFKERKTQKRWISKSGKRGKWKDARKVKQDLPVVSNSNQ